MRTWFGAMLAMVTACCSPQASSPGSVGQGPLIDALRSDCVSFLMARVRDPGDRLAIVSKVSEFGTVAEFSTWAKVNLTAKPDFSLLRFNEIFSRYQVPVDEKLVLKTLGDVAGELK